MLIYYILYTQSDDIIDIWAHCNRLFIEVIDRHAPLKKKLVRGNTVSWITPKIFGLQTQDIVCIENLLRTKTSENWETYRKQQNFVTSLKRQCILH